MMRIFFAVCLLVVGGWLVVMTDMLLFLDILAHLRGISLAVSALLAAVFLCLGVLAVKKRRRRALGITLLLSALVMWATAGGYMLVNPHPRWSRLLPTDFSDSFGNLTLAFGCLVLQTVIGMLLMLEYQDRPD